MYQKTTLDNGLRVVTANMPHTRSVCIIIFVGTGSRYETEAEVGISHFVEHLLFKGTTKRATAREISGAIEGVGGILNAATDREITLYWCKVSVSHLPIALDVLVDILFHSRFDPQDIEKERQVIIEEINLGKDSPQQRVNTLIDQLLWPNHPLGRDVAGTTESVAAISRKMMLGYLQGQYLAGNTVVAIAGNIQHQEIVATISQTMSNWTNSASKLNRHRYSAYQEQPTTRLHIEKKDTEQAHLCLGLPGLSLLHPKRFTLDLLNVILGEGMSSRLFTEIRDKLGLTYSIHSYVEHFLDCGSIVISAAVEPQNLPLIIKATLGQLSQLKELIPELELSKAKEQVKGRLLLRLEDSRSVAGWIGGQEILTGHILNTDQLLSIINAITADELQQLAQELLRSSQLHLAVVGPVSNQEPLEELLSL